MNLQEQMNRQESLNYVINKLIEAIGGDWKKFEEGNPKVSIAMDRCKVWYDELSSQYQEIRDKGKSPVMVADGHGGSIAWDPGRLRAFPGDWPETNANTVDSHQQGLTKLEYFTAAALNGMCANATNENDWKNSRGDVDYPEYIGRWAVMVAKATLLELNNKL